VGPLRGWSRLSPERSYRAYLCARMKLTGRGAGGGGDVGSLRQIDRYRVVTGDGVVVVVAALVEVVTGLAWIGLWVNFERGEG